MAKIDGMIQKNNAPEPFKRGGYGTPYDAKAAAIADQKRSVSSYVPGKAAASKP